MICCDVGAVESAVPDTVRVPERDFGAAEL